MGEMTRVKYRIAELQYVQQHGELTADQNDELLELTEHRWVLAQRLDHLQDVDPNVRHVTRRSITDFVTKKIWEPPGQHQAQPP